MQENALLLFELSTAFDTETRDVRIRCRNEHVFIGEIPSVINVEQSPELLEEITQAGCAICRCPSCHETVRVAEPFVIHDAKLGRAAVFLPEELGHRELHVRACWAFAVARCEVEKLPSYYEEACVLLGRRELEKWQIGLDMSHPERPKFLERGIEREEVTHLEVRDADEKTIQRPKDTASASGHGIHAAFADLAEGDVPVKAEPDIAGYNEPEAQFDDDDDWLNDAMIEANSRMESAPPPRDEKEKPAEHLEQEEDLPTLSSLDEAEDSPTVLDPSTAPDESHEEIEEINENDISIITSGSDRKSDSRPTTPLPVGIEEPSARSTCGAESGNVVLGRSVPAAAVRWFSGKSGDLLIHYHLMDEVPVVTLCLVGDDYRDVEKGGRVIWFLDLASDAHREVLQMLSNAFLAEVRLFTQNLEDVAQFQVAADREENARRIWQRVQEMGSKSWTYEQIEAARKRVEEDLNSGVLEPPFDESRLARPTGLVDCVQRLSFLAQWLAQDAYEELIFVRSYPLNKLEGAIEKTLEVALELGVRIPPVLKETALKKSGLEDLKTMVRQGFLRLKASSSKEDIEVGELARMWVGHLADARYLNATLGEEISEHARNQISEAGKDPDEEIEVALQALNSSVSRPSVEENARGALDEPADT